MLESADPAAVRRREMCRRLIAARKLVGNQLGYELLPSPTWDMLLDLYLAHHDGRNIYLWSLCMAAHVPTSSAHRKIAELTRKGLLHRHADDEDGRRVSVDLTEQCVARLDTLMDSLSIALGVQTQGPLDSPFS